MILVDADSMPVKDIIIELAQKYNTRVRMYFDSSHIYQSDYAEVRIVEKGKDSVDFYILNDIADNDIIITQDYGLACIALTKRVTVITQNGLIINEFNINSLLEGRYIRAKSRERIKGPRKRTSQNNSAFYNTLETILKNEGC